MKDGKKIISIVCYIIAFIFGVVGVFLAYLNNEIITGFFKGLIMEVTCFLLMQLVLAIILFLSKSKVRSEMFENAGLLGFTVYTIGTPIMFLVVYKDFMGAIISIISCIITLIVPYYIYNLITPNKYNKYASYVPDDLETNSSDKEIDKNKEKKKDFVKYDTEKKFDQYGNYMGKVTTLKVGDVETKTYENKDGKKTFEDTTFYW